MMILNTYYRQIAMRSMLLFVTAIITLSVSAIPAKPGVKRLLTLTDGTTIEARLVGDEHGHYWLGTNGKAYQKTKDGKTYQLVDAEQVKQQAQVRRDKINQQRAKRMPGAKRAAGTSSISGEKKGIIILVNFADDVKFQEENDNAYFQLIANKENFQDDYFYGSVHDYFLKQSEGKFSLTFDVAGPYTLKHEMSHYGANDAQGNDVHPGEMVIEALDLADEDVNFSDYDWDGDRVVDQVYVIYAGKSENECDDDNTIWPHEWSLSSAQYYGDGSGAQALDGVTIDTYACGSELNGQGAICGIGTICHEFSHCLGYPDYYDTDYSGGQGMGYWDLMDSGSYNGGGYCPAGYTSYERWAAGWIEPVELITTTKVENMKALQDEANAYIIYNEGNRNEFFLLENRQFIDWDRGLPGSGLLILHCDYNANAWNNNKPNDDPSHQRMTWIPADNKYESFMYNGEKYYDWEGMMTDTYPYTTNTGQIINNAFSATTTPAAKFYNKNADGTYFMTGEITDITQNSDGTVSFRYKGLSNVPTPTFSPVAGTYTEAQTVTISCTDAEASIRYTTDGTEPSENSTVYTEPIYVETTTTLKAIAVSKDGEESNVATAKFIIRIPGTEVNTFRRATSASDLVSGQRCIIARGDKGVAAGALSFKKYMQKVNVDIDEEGIITINDDVLVFTLNGSGNSFSFQTDDGDYLYAIKTKELGFSDKEKIWTLDTESNELIMKYESYGRMLYNSLTPRFTTYASGTSNTMLLAQIYVEYKPTPTPPPTPVEGTGIYELVTSDEMLEAERNYLIVSLCNDQYYAYNGFDTNKGVTSIMSLDDAECISLNDGVNSAVPVILVSTDDGWLFYDKNEKAYIGTTTVTSTSERSKAYLTTSVVVNSDYYKWTIGIEDNIAIVKNNGKDFYLKFNENSTYNNPMFRVYASGQNDIMLYKEMPVKQEIGITTGVNEAMPQVSSNKSQVTSNDWFTIDGRRLSGMPTKKGVYIHNGQAVIR